MKIFIDFDDVIFNTKEFGIYLREFYDSHGVSDELVKKYYYNPGTGTHLKLFDPEGLFSRLETHEKMDVSGLRKNFSLQLKNISRFVFEDVEEFLKRIGKENLYLVSFGLPSFQGAKITGSGVDELVCDFKVTSNLKAQAIGEIIGKIPISPEEKMIFIDDRVEQIEDVKKTFPKMITFLLCRKEGRYCDQKNEFCDYEIHDLKEAQEIISNL